MSKRGFDEIKNTLRAHPRKWLITGVAGFIGSNLLEALLDLGQTVVGLDNFSTGYSKNLEEVERGKPAAYASRFRFIQADIRDAKACADACAGVDYVLHQAALGSVPRSIEQPVHSADSNISGFFQIITAAKDAGVKKFIYASSSSVYGDCTNLPQREDLTGKVLSPYALTKLTNELTADVYARVYGLQSVGLRYFNVFGKRQNPEGAYAAVVPLWIKGLIRGEPIFINGDGSTSRDFCYIENVVQANILAATRDTSAGPQVFNVSAGGRTSLNELYQLISDALSAVSVEVKNPSPHYRSFRPGDVRHSMADISLVGRHLGYAPEYDVKSGLAESVKWYAENL